jgi:hypothetical protein
LDPKRRTVILVRMSEEMSAAGDDAADEAESDEA